jgi:DEAD/DEAH box helicase
VHASLTELELACLEFCVSLICHRMQCSEFESPLVRALCMLAVGPSGWAKPGTYTQYLSAFLTVGNMLLLQHATQKAFGGKEKLPDIYGELQAVKSKFGVRGTGTPFQWAIDLRTYGMKIHFAEGNEGEVHWDNGRLLFRNCRLTSTDFQGMVHGMLHRARALLFDDVLMGAKPEDLPGIPWDDLLDNPSTDGVGSCVTGVWEAAGLRGAEDWLLERILADEDRCDTFWDAQRQSLRSSGMRAYVQLVDELLCQFSGLIHLTYGLPARGTEVLTVLHSNTGFGSRRNIIVSNGQLGFVIDYNKTGWRPIFRFLPREVGELVLYYLHFALPMRNACSVHLSPDHPPSPYFWPREKMPGTRAWTTERLSSRIGKAFATIGCHDVGLSEYRHIAIGLARHEVPQALLGSGDEQGEGGDATAPTAEEQLQRFMDAQAGHSSEVAGAFYAVECGTLLSSRTRRGGDLAATTAWHRYLGFLPGPAPPADADRIQARARHMQTRRQAALGGLDLKATFKSMCGHQAEFRGEQEEALRHVVANDRFVVVVMPTGEGKSVIWQLPAFAGLGGVTVVVVPLRALEEDLLNRCRHLRISGAIWKAGAALPNDVSLVFTTPEAFVKKPFQAFVNQCLERRALDRVVIDECHEVFLSFRSAYHDLHRQLDHTVQIVCLTATLKPGDEETLCTGLGYPPSLLTMVRQPTTLKHIGYGAMDCSHLNTEEKAVAFLRRCFEDFWASTDGRQTQLVYCNRIQLAQQFAASFPGISEVYFSGREDGARVLGDFQAGKILLLFTTTALGEGVHIENAGCSWFHGSPKDFEYFQQGAGRTRRSRLPGKVVVLHGWMDMREPSRDMKDFIRTPGCRRVILDRLDGRVGRAGCEPDEVRCDRCEEHVPSPSPATAPAGSAGEVVIVPSTCEPCTAELPHTPLATPVNRTWRVTSTPSSSISPYRRSQKRPSSPATALPPPKRGAGSASSSFSATSERTMLDARKEEVDRAVRTARSEIVAATMERWEHLGAALRHLSDFCLACGDLGHGVQSCAGQRGIEVTELARAMRKGLVFDRFSCCKDCLGPQAFCARWTRGEDDFGFSFDRSVRECSLQSVMGNFYYLWQYFGPEYHALLAEPPHDVDIGDAQAVYRHLGTRVVIKRGEAELTNMLLQFEIMVARLEQEFGDVRGWGCRGVMRGGLPRAKEG